MTPGPMENFHPIVRRWFERRFGAPSPPQLQGWPSISQGKNTLILAPTGSGKTLAAFLWAINHLIELHLRGPLSPGVRLLYVSPLKALNNDIQRNLKDPLEGIRREAEAAGIVLPLIRTAVRTGDTTQAERSAMVRRPPDILITTPESLYLLLTSARARPMLRSVHTVIVDEIHSMCGNKRGVHLSLSLERLQEIADQEFIRIGLSATQRPLDRIASFLGGQEWRGGAPVPRPVTIVDAGRKKEMDLQVICAAPDFGLLPQESTWPLVFDELLDTITRHRTTLIFVNNRRLAERVAATLNELIAGPAVQDNDGNSGGASFNLYAVPRPTTASDAQGPLPLVQAYHGSMSREARESMEEALKAGALRALVATSSLELGIDIGSIDLVVQLQSPRGVARGLQRVGRSGHLVTATSKGRIFPTHREDLVESAVVGRAMLRHEVEETTIPTNCLDVLAQHIVAMVSIEEWSVEKLFALVRRSTCYRSLSRTLFMGVVRMLAGRYADEAFRELRARLSWDRVNDTLRALPGSGRLAVTGGGTIADRGYFGVYLENGTTRVGEVDEEFVYESRTGDTFLLGTSVWRITGIDAQRLTVVPAPGQPARMPFWRGEGFGRSFELGTMVGAFRREVSDRLHGPECLPWLQKEFPVDSRSAWNIHEYFRKQHQVAGVIPHDRLILVEGFRDEIGDPRIVVHSSFGRRVNSLLGLVLARRLHAISGIEPQMFANDDGILLRSTDAETLPLHLFDGLTAEDAEHIVLDDIPSSPLFGGQFRQNAARSLLLPRIAPGKRTPLWLQRLRAGDLLQVARRFDDFPIVIETMREVLHEVLDFDHFREIIRGIVNGEIGITTVQTEIPSPFAASILFDFIAVYMYEWDQPKEDRMSQYLAVNREILGEAINLDSVSSLIRPEAAVLVEQQLQHVADGYRARSPEELLEILLRLGDLSDEEAAARCAGDSHAMLAALQKDGRAVQHEFPNGKRWIAGEERALYADLHSGGSVTKVLRRYSQNRGPLTSAAFAERYGLNPAWVEELTEEHAGSMGLARGRFLSDEALGGGEAQWCYRPTIERIHRQTLHILRHEITPCTLAEFTRLLAQWHHLTRDTHETGGEGTLLCLEQLRGLPLPAEIWERDILRGRVREYTSSLLDHASATGILLWAGSGAGKLRPVPRGDAGAFLSLGDTGDGSRWHEPARRILRHLQENGASFFHDIRNGTSLSLAALNNGIAELFWDGVITNDVFGELQKVKRPSPDGDAQWIEPVHMTDPRHNPERARLLHKARRALRQVPGWSGRWSLVHTRDVLGPPLPPEEQADKQVGVLLDRYGILAREFHRREDLLPWPILAARLQQMELRGTIRRGYFVEGLSGMQYALPSAVDLLRRIRSTDAREDVPLLLNACDPANPYGSGVGMAGIMVNRSAGTYIAFRAGTPILLLERYGARLTTAPGSDMGAIGGALGEFIALLRLPTPLRPFRAIVVEYVNGERPTRTPFASVLRESGFLPDKNQSMRLDAYG
jgi:ATP-dependent Lhr-like helicase